MGEGVTWIRNLSTLVVGAPALDKLSLPWRSENTYKKKCNQTARQRPCDPLGPNHLKSGGSGWQRKTQWTQTRCQGFSHGYRGKDKGVAEQAAPPEQSKPGRLLSIHPLRRCDRLPTRLPGDFETAPLYSPHAGADGRSKPFYSTPFPQQSPPSGMAPVGIGCGQQRIDTFRKRIGSISYMLPRMPSYRVVDLPLSPPLVHFFCG